MVGQILNSQRLVQLAAFHPNLKNLWYLVAATTFSVCNEPQELKKLYHFAMLNDTTPGDSLKSAHKTIELFESGFDEVEELINNRYAQPTLSQRRMTQKFREALLKSSALAGIPKAINGLQALKLVTPNSLKPVTEDIDANSDRLLVGTMRPTGSSIEQGNKHGIAHWNMIYNKVSNKVVNNLNSSYPDLWQYILCNVYGPLLSFDEILDAQETSLVVIASLVPQDLNLQLWGHLKGALNVGCDQETVSAAENLSIVIAQWCEVKWKADVVKL
ncbi:LADA_0D01640g1_1 [Lachancea dasiensis]|uniref:LADA_0D01640g1_1 n=1 Tax=Lachancea dasiensis TaxID=1072105 RepID=A0A1G4J4M8_9SACH|nr:LADA_0D01640g1_1 [Lachancea dasiensis]